MRSSTGQSSEYADKLRSRTSSVESRTDWYMAVLRSYLESLNGARREGRSPRLVKLLAAGAQKLDVSGRGPDFQSGTAPVQLAFRRETLWARPVAAFAGDANVDEVGLDLMAICQIDAGANGHGHVGSDVNHNVARRCLQYRVAAFATRDKLCQDPARATFCPGLGNPVQLDPASPGFRAHYAFGPAQANAAAAGFNFARPRNIPQFDIPPARGYLEPATALLDGNIAAARFQSGFLGRRNQHDVAATGGRVDSALGVGDVDAAAAGLQVEVSIDAANINAVAPGLGGHRSAYIVQVDFPPAALGLYAARDFSDRHATAGILDLGEIEAARNVNHELARAEIVSVSLPVALDECRVSVG